MIKYILLIFWFVGALYFYQIGKKVSDRRKDDMIETYSKYISDNKIKFIPIFLDAVIIGITLLWPIALPITAIDMKIEEMKNK